MGAAVSATGNVLVGNLDLNRVDVFSRDGSFVRTFGGGVAGGAGPQTCTTGCSYGSSGGGAGDLSAPWGVATDMSGHVVVAEFGNDRVSVFTESGAFVRTFGWGVTTGAGALEVCTSNCHAGIPGPGAGQLDHPRGVALDGAGNVFVVDALNDRVEEFTLCM
jgi:DNA-binding beta-propeller fold protein YncE